MKLLTTLVCAVAFTAALVAGEAPAKKKNWTAPAGKIYAQTLADQVKAAHPELISITLQGTPPGTSGVYTMFAGSFPERIGNACDPDDVDVITKGITISDPRWRRSDPVKKFVLLLPLRDAAGENVGLLVLAYKNDGSFRKTEQEFFLAATALRDALQKKIPSFAALFEPSSS